MKSIFIILFLLFYANILLAQEKIWNIRIEYPSSPLAIYINDIHLLNIKELGEIKWVNTDVYTQFLLWTSQDTLFVTCTEYPTNCPSGFAKQIIIPKQGLLNKKFRLKIISQEYKFNILVKAKHGRFIHFTNDYEFKKVYGRWYQQNDEPFEYGSSPPKRIE